MTDRQIRWAEVYRKTMGSMQLLWRVGPQYSRLFGRSGPTVAEWLLVHDGKGIVASGCERERSRIEALQNFTDSARRAVFDDVDDALLEYLVEWHWVEFVWPEAPARRVLQ